jgi:(p)ppGpp synthase/HD superfamily hydrolase
MNYDISPQDSFRVENAIQFLVTNYAKSGHNPKPVILHSIRTAMYLLELSYETDIIIAAILHDLIEDTATSRDEIEQEFCETIANIVASVSFRGDITDPVEQYRDLYSRALAAGRAAIMVKAADLHSNSLYIRLVPDRAKQEKLLAKYEYFLGLTTEYQDEVVIQDLADRYRRERARLRAEEAGSK